MRTCCMQRPEADASGLVHRVAGEQWEGWNQNGSVETAATQPFRYRGHCEVMPEHCEFRAWPLSAGNLSANITRLSTKLTATRTTEHTAGPYRALTQQPVAGYRFLFWLCMASARLSPATGWCMMRFTSGLLPVPAGRVVSSKGHGPSGDAFPRLGLHTLRTP